MAHLHLYIGNKNYSSWSLRGWLAAKMTGERFVETIIPLSEPESKARLLRKSPAGRVPILHHGSLVVWDSLAIAEYLAEKFPRAQMWPEDPRARAVARSVSAEMHSGFAALRQHYPMNIRRRVTGRAPTPGASADIARITAMWNDCRSRFGAGGDFLFGKFSIADAMYAPVVTRFVTYAIDVDPVAAAYMKSVLAHPAVEEWSAAARKETSVIAEDEV